MNPAWYLRRLQRMEPSELVGRVHDQALRWLWRRVLPDVAARAKAGRLPGCAVVKSLPAPSQAPPTTQDLIRCADEILAGRWQIFAKQHPGLGEEPDWFVDARSGKRAPGDEYAFAVRYRDENAIGNIKYIWEPSRHHHLTVLAAAYYLTSDERYARRVADHLNSWWRDNPFLRGPHWISGIELGLRLISWAWVRQLLQNWSGIETLFDRNELFTTQLYAHQYWLSHFPSRGSSANNHIIAEAAGQFVAGCVFPFFRESAQWRTGAAKSLAREALAQTFACGSNRELATDYHGFVLELLIAAMVQGDACDQPLDDAVWVTACRMSDVIAAMLDERGHPPHQGDGDDGIGLLLDAPSYNRWLGLLATGERLFGGMAWWPQLPAPDVRTFLMTEGVNKRAVPGRPLRQPHMLTEAGQVFLLSAKAGVWCRCDHGPHGFGRIAAHAHADALSIELRIRGVEIFADPGTYCYHGDPHWRDYFRSTRAHNTLCLFGRDQSTSGGPFLWTRQAESKLVDLRGLDEDEPEGVWLAEHTGYQAEFGLTHRRSVQLLRETGRLVITDSIRGGRTQTVPATLSWHLGPDVACELIGHMARLAWPGGQAEIELPSDLDWSACRGEEAAGWYSPAFDLKMAATSLIGSGMLAIDRSLSTTIRWSQTDGASLDGAPL